MGYYLEHVWKLYSVGTARDKTFDICGFEAGRHQCGLKYQLNLTVHTSMSDTLSIIVIEISENGSNYKLLDKAQAIVLLGKACVGSDIVFVGSKQSTIAALVKIIRLKSQYMDYMECVLDLVSINNII